MSFKLVIPSSVLFLMMALQLFATDSPAIDAHDNISPLLQQAQQLVFKNPDSAFILIEQARLTDGYAADENAQGLAYYLLGNIHLVKGQYPNALEYYEKSLAIRQEIQDFAGVSDLYSNIGIIYARMGDQETYLSYLQKTLQIDREMGNEHMVAVDYNNIGNVYLNSDEPHEALSYYKKALEYAAIQTDSSLLYAIYGNVGNVFMLLEKHDTAMVFSQQAIQIAEQTNNSFELGTAYKNHALLFSKLEQYDSALFYYDAAIQILETTGDKSRLAGVLNDKAGLMISMEDASQAIAIATKSLSISEAINDMVLKSEALEIYALGFEILGDYKAALSYRKSYAVLNDSLNISGKEAALQKMMRRFEVNEKKREIMQLEMKNELERSRNHLLVLTILLVVVFMIVLFFKNRQQHKSYHLLLEKHKQITNLKTQHLASKQCQTEETTDQKDLIIKLEQLLEQQKVFLDAGISLDTLSDILNTNRNALSAVINAHYNKNFNMLINEYRINEVIQLFAENHHKRFTLEAISKQVGFGNRASFNAAFKKLTGVTPTFYIDNM